MIVEAEPAEGLSTHKLLIETAKHNVLTAYTGREGLAMLQRFPDVDAIVYDTALEDLTCEQFSLEVLKQNFEMQNHRVNAPGPSAECQVRVQGDFRRRSCGAAENA
jgi:CheY-like chemotaxis protein